jgi:hypothetical protein
MDQETNLPGHREKKANFSSRLKKTDGQTDADAL